MLVGKVLRARRLLAGAPAACTFKTRCTAGRARHVLHAAERAGLPNPCYHPLAHPPSSLPCCRYEPQALEVVREVPLPGLQELGGYLPNQRFPSDHLPVVFDLRFRAAGASGDAAAASGAAGAAAGGWPAAGGGGGAPPGAGNVLPAALYNVGLAAEALQRDEVIAVPTDTLYGLAACANSSAAVAHIYATKRRQDHTPLAIAVADVADVPRFGETQVGRTGAQGAVAASGLGTLAAC